MIVTANFEVGRKKERKTERQKDREKHRNKERSYHLSEDFAIYVILHFIGKWKE